MKQTLLFINLENIKNLLGSSKNGYYGIYRIYSGYYCARWTTCLTVIKDQLLVPVTLMIYRLVLILSMLEVDNLMAPNTKKVGMSLPRVWTGLLTVLTGQRWNKPANVPTKDVHLSQPRTDGPVLSKYFLIKREQWTTICPKSHLQPITKIRPIYWLNMSSGQKVVSDHPTRYISRSNRLFQPNRVPTTILGRQQIQLRQNRNWRLDPAQVSIQARPKIWRHEILEDLRLDVRGSMRQRFTKGRRLRWHRLPRNVHSISQFRRPSMDHDQPTWLLLHQTWKGFLLQDHDRLAKRAIWVDCR